MTMYFQDQNCIICTKLEYKEPSRHRSEKHTDVAHAKGNFHEYTGEGVNSKHGFLEFYPTFEHTVMETQ